MVCRGLRKDASLGRATRDWTIGSLTQEQSEKEDSESLSVIHPRTSETKLENTLLESVIADSHPYLSNESDQRKIKTAFEKTIF